MNKFDEKKEKAKKSHEAGFDKVDSIVEKSLGEGPVDLKPGDMSSKDV